MSSDSVGQIGLDLVVNRNGFERQMQGITGLAKKAGAVLAGAFAVKKLVDFGAQCLELGSNLSEVQNVVDVTFPQMSARVNKFAKDAASAFGLSETMTKKFTGTFGAMAKAFGFPERAAYEMSTALTGLAGDVASFYNISQDEAFTKLKSVFTGETESLKDLGIVMTQTALDEYALANGFGKTTQAMSEAEKVSLRYKFVQEQLTLASGDFIRTSDGWANQVRILKLQFDSLKATIGQGLINVLTPVVKMINLIIGKLMTLANAFKALTEMMTGKKSSGGASTLAGEAAEEATGAKEALDGVAGAAKKAKKATAATGIDELNIISQDEGGSGGSEGGGAGTDYAPDDFDMGEVDTTPLDAIDSKYKALIDRVKELSGLFKEGFQVGFGDSGERIEDIKKSLGSIKESLIDIFTDNRVVSAANKYLNALFYSWGQMAGAVTSIGITIASNLIGGIDLFLQQNKDRIKVWLVSMFDIHSEIASIRGNFAAAVADIFSVFAGDNGKQVTANLIGIFSSAFMGVTELGSKFGRDILDTMTAPIIENKDKFKVTIDGLLGALSECLGTVKGVVDSTFQKIGQVYDEHVKPMIDSFRDGWSRLTGMLLDAYNTHFLPVINNLADKFGKFAEEHLQPMINKAVELIGKVADIVRQLWEEHLAPFLEWFITNVSPYIAIALEAVGNAFSMVWGVICDTVGFILEALGGLIDFVVGVLTKDWEQAWNGIKTFFAGIWNALNAGLATSTAAVKSKITSMLDSVKNVWDTIWTAIKTFFTDIWDSIKAFIAEALEFIRAYIELEIKIIQTIWGTIWMAIKVFFINLWNAIKSFIEETIEKIKSGLFEKLNLIKEKWTEIWTGMKTTISNVFTGIWGFLKDIINKILGGIEKMANGVVSGINKVIDALNGLSFKTPDWLPDGMGGKTFGFNIPKMSGVSLPRLAQGGYVKANTPQLAMIGDNRHQGEVVAPEDKMQEMVDKAVSMVSGGDMSDQYLSIMVGLLKKIVDLIEAMDLTVYIDVREIKRKLVDLENRSGIAFGRG